MNFGNMSPGVQAGLALAGGATLLTVLGALVQYDAMAMLIIALGIVVVGLLLLGFRALLKWRQKRRSAPLEQGIAQNAASAPQGVSEPARRARLDDLRRAFDTGVAKFRAAGKNLYSVPWYVIVGEPGSGKTEAIRHCNVGFPPGLQDQLQGAGGTLNMNWWFTNHAIILDTAGRLMFEEVQPGSTSEWQEFLKLLNSGRPNCPINGMVLVIPVDTLIKDTADSIEKKATKIAQQFDSIQRALGVRFPVFVVITKCDLLNGFREFFDDLNDPQLQHQIMVWSNPNPLDVPFNPELVEKHLDAVKKRLIDRRTRLLLDPVNTEDATAKRVEQVDALYALPESIMKIVPRLRRYLEMIFVSGEWSLKPLFLRGIYFTSSMTEGSALDADLAEVLGVPVDNLPEGRIWQRDRAFFLRDLFLNKVFKEKGLVTRAGNAAKLQRQRRAVVLGFGFLAVLVLFAFTFLGYRELNESIGKHRDFWRIAQKLDLKDYAPFVPGPAGGLEYHGTEPLDIGPYKGTKGSFFGDYLAEIKPDMHVPLIFRPVAAVSGSLDTDRRRAYRGMYEQMVLDPVVQEVRAKVGSATVETWSADTSEALAQLLRLEAAHTLGAKSSAAKVPAADEASPFMDLKDVLRVVLSKDDYDKVAAAEKANKDKTLQNALDWIYASNGGGGPWPPKRLFSEDPKTMALAAAQIAKGVDTAIAAWSKPLAEARAALLAFQAAEDELLKRKGKMPERAEAYGQFVEIWGGQLAKLVKAHDDLSRVMQAIDRVSPSAGTAATTAPDAASTELTRLRDAAAAAYEKLLQAIPENKALDAVAADDKAAASMRTSAQALVTARNRLEDARKGLSALNTGDLAGLDRDFLTRMKGTDNQPHRRYDVALGLYQMVDKQLPRDLATGGPAGAAPAAVIAALNTVDSEISGLNSVLDKVNQQVSNKDDRFAQTLALNGDLLATAARARRYQVINAALAGATKTAEAWADFVAAQSKPSPKLQRPDVPLTMADAAFSSKYDPDVAGALADETRQFERLLTAKGDVSPILDRDALATRLAAYKPSVDRYLAAYSTYWTRDCFDELKFTAKNWPAYAARLGAAKESGLRGALSDYAEKAKAALRAINDQAGLDEVSAAQEGMERRVIKDQVTDALLKWQSLREDTKLARRTILAMQPTRFRNDFVLSDFKPADGFVMRFWTAFAVESLRILATDGQAQVMAGLDEIKKYDKFPLAPLGDGSSQLTAADVAAARSALQDVLGEIDATAATPDQETIGQGGLTRNKAIDEQLDRLRGLNVLAASQKHLNQLKAVLRALPDTGKTLACRIAVAKDKLKGDNSVSNAWAWMVLTQGKDLGTADLRNLAADTIEKAEFPGAALMLGFRKSSTAPVDKTVTLDGPWAPVRALFAPGARRDPDDKKKWLLELPVKDDQGKVWSVWLQLSFDQELPEVADWPNAKK